MVAIVVFVMRLGIAGALLFLLVRLPLTGSVSLLFLFMDTSSVLSIKPNPCQLLKNQ
jgi:hypothetical protein